MQTGAILSIIALAAAVFTVLYYLCCGRKLSVKHLFAFSTKLSGYLNAGMPLNGAFKELMEEFSVEPGSFRHCLGLIKSDLSKGSSLSGALEKHKQFFPNYYVKMIATGEKTDSLPETLTQLARMQQSLSEKSLEVRNALVYPVVVLILLLTASLFVSDFLVPTYMDLYDSMNIEMPGIFLFFLLAAGKTGSITAAFLILIIIGVVWYYLNREKLKPVFDELILKTPIVGKLRTYFEYILLSRSLAFMTAKNLPTDQIFSMLADISSNTVFKNRLQEAADRPIPEITGKLQVAGVFSPSFIWLASQGESTGALTESMDLLGSYYSDELNLQSEKLAKSLEVILVLTAGFITGIIAFGIFAPFLSISARLIQNIVVF